MKLSSILLPARAGMGLAWHPAGRVVWGEEFREEPLAVVTGVDGEDVETAGEGALRRTKAWPPEAVKGMSRWPMAMRGAKGWCIGSSSIPV